MAGKPQSQVGRVCNGKRIAKTRPGMMPGPAKVGEIIDCLNPLLNIKILLTDGDEAKATISDGGLVLQIPNTASSAPGTGATVNWRGLYNDEETYALADAVYTEPDSSTRILWVCETVNGPGSPQSPIWPEPTGTIYWRCYGRSSGASLVQYRLTTLCNADYFGAKLFDGTSESGDEVYIAKPFLARKQGPPSGFTYTSSSENARTSVDGAGYTEAQVMNEPYAVGNVVLAKSADHTGVTMAKELKLIEDNPERFWVHLVGTAVISGTTVLTP